MNKSLEEIEANADFLCICGSRLYGTHTEKSDTDLRGFWLPPAPCLLKRDRFEQIESSKKDTCVFALDKFFHLLEVGAPNVIELLFAPKENIIKLSPIGERVLVHRNLFISKRCINPILGFSRGQWHNAIHQKNNFKPAYHAIRLLWQGWELCDTGKITFPTPMATFLLDVKNGKFHLAELEEIYNASFEKLEKVVEKCSLPDNNNKEGIDALYYECTKDCIVQWYNQYA